MSNCQCTTDIIQDGSGQLGRYLKALDPSYAPIDDRSIEDLLVFAKRYAGQIRFYDIPGSNINDGVQPGKVSWREFFRRDLAVTAASVAVLNISNVKKEYDELRERLDAEPSPEKLAAAFALSISIATRIDRWYTVAIPENPLRTDLDLAINAHLRMQMKRIMAYEDGYKFIDSRNPLNLDYSGIQNDETWGLKDPIDPDATIYQGSTIDDKIRNATLYADEIFNDFFSTLQSFIHKGPNYMAFALEQYPAHQPHMALFITFLQIFKLAQEQMNGLTGKMLDFYYKEVLQLTPKDSIPDKTHVIFELASNIAQYDIPAGTTFSAGKDASGKEQVYKSATDLVVNQAKVKELKTIFIEKKDPVAPKKTKSIRSIFASPVANSADGYGTAFTEANPKWPTFGKGISLNKGSANICKSIDAIKENLLTAPAVQTGFAIASPQLVLEGGKRMIALKVPGISAISGEGLAALLENPFEIWLTGEKEWLKVDKVMKQIEALKFLQLAVIGYSGFVPDTDDLETSYFVDAAHDTIYVYLPIAEKAVVAYDAKLHKGYNYKTAYPVMQVMLNEQMHIDEEVYNTIKATELLLEVKIGSINPGSAVSENIFKNLGIRIPEYNFDGLETVIIQTAEGLFPSDKPFNPFTQYPGPGKSLYIGSEEIFNKPLGQLAVNLRRTQQHLEKDNTGGKSAGFVKAATFSNIKPLGVSVLSNRSWKDVTTTQGTDFDQVDLTENILIVGKRNAAGGQVVITPVPLERTPIEKIAEYKNQVSKGFIRIDYLPQLDNNDGQFTTMQASQDLAARAEMKEISVNYHSALTKLDSAIDQLFHVYPFGVVETYFGDAAPPVKTPAIAKSGVTSFAALDKQKGNLLVNANNLLLPQYTFLDTYNAYTNSEQASAHGGTYGTPPVKRDILSKLVLASSGVRETVQGGNNQYSNKLQEQGMLFIGLEKAVPLQSLSLLFQFAEGSAQDEDNDPPAIHWSYLTNNEWRPMRGEDVVSDGTYGFQTTGIVKLNIPADATSNNTIITKGLHWFAISVTENAHRIPQLVNVVTQAAEVVFEDNDNDQSHFNSALPAGTISKLSVKVAEVSKVEQPFSSFDGKHKEVSREFYTRVSERLRHKGRAINSWDYEHLVLDRFPSVYKVKCITATDPNCLCRDKISATYLIVAPIKYYMQLDENRSNKGEFVAIGGTEGKDLYETENLLKKDPTQVLRITVYTIYAADNNFEIATKIANAAISFFRVNKNITVNKIITNIAKTKGVFVDLAISLLSTPWESTTFRIQLQKVSLTAGVFEPNKETKSDMEAALEFVIANQNKVSLWIYVYVVNKKTDEADQIAQNAINFFSGKQIDPKNIRYLLIESGLLINLDLGKEEMVSDVEVCCGPQIAPGHVLLIPISNLKNRNSINPLQPKTSRIVLLEMEAYLKKLTSPFVKVHAKNPVYEQIIVGFRVQFYTGIDQGFYLKELNREIVAFLTPWAFDENADVQFGQKIYASSIINFIEERPYVDFITDFAMGVCKDECCKPATAASSVMAIQPFRKAAETATDATATAILAGFKNMKGVITDSKTGNPIQDATITVKGTTTETNTAADGSFAIDLESATAVLIVKAAGYKDAEAAVVGLIDFRLAMIRAESNGDSMAEILAGLCGCSDIEALIGEYADKRGEIVAKPSTARSILVSVPQHIIIPYTAPVKETRCEVRKKKKLAQAAEAAQLPAAEVKSAPPVAPVSEAPKGNVKGNMSPAKDEVKAGKRTFSTGTEKPEEPAKDLIGLSGINSADLKKLNPLIKADDTIVKNPPDAVKDELVAVVAKETDALSVNSLGDELVKPAESIEAAPADIKAPLLTKAAETVKEKLTMPDNTVAKPVKKAAKTAASSKPNKKNK